MWSTLTIPESEDNFEDLKILFKFSNMWTKVYGRKSLKKDYLLLKNK